MKFTFLRIVLLACLLSAQAASATVVQASAVNQQPVLGASVLVTISIAGLDSPSPQSLAAFDLDLSFDPTILALTGVSYGTGLDVLGLGSLQFTTESTHLVNLLEISLDDAATLSALQGESFQLVALTFSTIGVGTSDLALTLNALGDANGASIAAQGIDGSVQVIGPPLAVPEPGTPVMLLAGLAVLAAFNRRRRGR
ncbi:PEP-CTERM protein-sorting domain-containing protein [Duganella sp. CF517]|uniref:cohesin domain-containing protein n=1 Tax=Duganella sp. CF517 TaxID=1881038 RepID=UPI0008BFC50A|nr:cohesin domain-containing protein [Duganella sp. CF517]SEO08273.1 PEP-CTERM protein-sorting domain-containing protein [Duganella sp. CF517]